MGMIREYRSHLWAALMTGAAAAAAGAIVGLALTNFGPWAEDRVTQAEPSRNVIVKPADELPTAQPSPAAVDEASVDGFTVRLFDSDVQGDTTTVFYSVEVPSEASYAEMVGTVRVANPDGTMAFPSVSGQVSDIDPAIVGVQSDAQSAAVFDSAEIQRGGVLTFGPFLTSEGVPVDIETTGAALRQGLHVTIAGDDFLATLADGNNIDGSGATTLMTLRNTTAGGTIQLNYPEGELRVSLDGVPAEVAKGGAGFTKSEGYEVGVGQAHLFVVGEVGDATAVTITAPSVGRLVKGDWSFTLD